MRILLLFITTIALPCQALTCGLYQVEDFGDRMLYSITRFPDGHTLGRQTLYTIVNPGTPVVKSMVRGLCYCVAGKTGQDPEFNGDENFQLITVESIVGNPFGDCLSLSSR